MTTTIEKILDKKTVSHLENLFSNTDLLKNFPVFDGKNIRIGKFSIVKIYSGFEVHDVENNNLIGIAFLC